MLQPGKKIGPDGMALIRVSGPQSAPTQHLTEYSQVMICASGIGVTPLAAAMKVLACDVIALPNLISSLCVGRVWCIFAGGTSVARRTPTVLRFTG